MSKEQIEKLKEKIRRADHYYYAMSEPEISDEEYDILFKNLKDLEEKYPRFITSDSPTQRVWDGLLKRFSTIEHKKRMLSLDNTYSVEELRGWEKKIKRALKRDVRLDYVVELKMDGVSAALTYEEGKFSVGATRGDGEKGEDVTANLKTIRSIPLGLTGKNIPKLVEVRGEIYIGKKDFERINKKRLDTGETSFVNPRNAASGSLKLLNPSLTAKRNLKCFIHSFGITEAYSFSSQGEFLKKADAWGFCLNPHNKYCKNLEEVIEYCLYWEGKRETLDYEVDGVVVKINSFSLQKELGATRKSPRWAVAYKFPAQQATTKIKKIDFWVGRTGIITPVAILEPVKCGGVTISRTTLHNFDELERLDVRVGDMVLIERAGEVIPKVVKVIASKRCGKEKKIKLPEFCPSCGSIVAKEKEGEVYPVRSIRRKGKKGKTSNGVYWYCFNPNCPAQLKRSLIHFASRLAMDIEGLGESLAEELIERKLVCNLAMIYDLKKDNLLELPLFKEKKADNLIDAIEKSKQRPLSNFLFGLGIRHVGEKAAIVLADNFKDIKQLSRVKKSELEKIPEIGPVMADSIVKFFAADKIKQMISSFEEAGVKLTQEIVKVKKSKITGKVFVFSGELKLLSRPKAKELIKFLGAKSSSAVSKNTNFLVVGKNPGSKYNKAKKLGVTIIGEETFIELTKG